jgi:hypothetical protein
MKLIQTQTISTSGTTGQVNFTSIPTNFDDLLLRISGRTDEAVIQNQLRIRLNGDTGSNYLYSYLAGDGSAVSVFNSTVSGMRLGVINGASTTSNTFSNMDIYIPNYKSSAQKTASADSVTENNATESWQMIFSGRWTGTEAINAIRVFPLTDLAFSANTTMSLYGITKGSDGITTAS